MKASARTDSLDLSLRIFHGVLSGQTIRQVAKETGVSRSSVEKRMRCLERRLQPYLTNEDRSAAPVPLDVMRRRSAEYRRALDAYLQHSAVDELEESGRALTASEIRLVAEAARRSRHGHRDHALVLTLFGTGTTPLEIAQLRVRDYLMADGDVRRQTILRKDVAFNKRVRPLIWTEAVISAVEDYLQDRATRRQGLSGGCGYRGFDPNSTLFLTDSGTAFPIKTTREGNGEHRLCHSLLDLYRRIFQRSGVPGASTRSARRTIASTLAQHGASEKEIGKTLGIKRRDCVRALLPAMRPSIPALLQQLF